MPEMTHQTRRPSNSNSFTDQRLTYCIWHLCAFAGQEFFHDGDLLREGRQVTSSVDVEPGTALNALYVNG